MSDAVDFQPIREAIEKELLTEWKANDEQIQPLTRIWKMDDFLKMFINHPRQTIPFDIADKILCVLQVQYLWWEELRDIYYSVDLSEARNGRLRTIDKNLIRCARIGCSNTFRKPTGHGGWNKKFCSRTCKVSENNYKKFGKGGRRRGPGHKLAALSCANGHSRTPENTFLDKRTGARMCRVCARINDKRYREKKILERQNAA